MVAYTQTKIFTGTEKELNSFIMDLQLADRIEIKDVHCVTFNPEGEYTYLIIYHIPNIELVQSDILETESESPQEEYTDANSIS